MHTWSYVNGQKKNVTLLLILKMNLTQTKAYKHFHYQRGFVHDKKNITYQVVL